MAALAPVHPSDQTLQSYGLGKLDDLQAEAVGKHLRECDSCRRRVAEVTSDSFVGRLRDAQARPESVPPTGSSLAGLSKLGEESRTPSPPPASTLPPGLAEPPDYQVLRELGRGGMGVVYLAENRMMGRKEVLKVVSSHLLNRQGVLERFLREIRSAAQLHHPNIVTAYSATRVGESIVFSMQYVEGYDLAKLVEKSGPLSVAHACNFVYQAALGLQHAHERGMVHRDIKPSNLMLARDGNKPVVKVLDFGLAKVTSERAVDGGLTSEGQMLGTPHYVAPEQTVNAQKADIRADIYSLGCTLYCLLTGHPPFDAPSLYELLQAHHSMDAKPLNFIRPEVPAELAAVVAKMLAKEPERRFQTPGEVAKALSPFFKPGANPGSGPSPEISRVGQAASSPQPAGGGSAPTQPANLGTSPAPAPRGPSKPSPEGVAWESVIEFKQTETVKEPAPAVEAPRRQRPPWMWPAIAAAFSFAMIALGITIYVTTDYGRIKIIVNGPEADVEVDGEQILIKTPRESITVRAGEHALTVKWRDGHFKTDKFVVRRGEDEELRVEYEPKMTDRAGTNRQTTPSSGTSSKRTAESPAGVPAGKLPAPPAVESVSRNITDRMLVIRTYNRGIMANAKQMFIVQIDPNINAELRDDKIYMNKVFDRKDVLCTQPLSPSSPGIMDFGGITKDRTGRLILAVHGYPGHVGQRIVAKSDGVVSKDVTVHLADGWKEIVVPFRRNGIVVEHHAEGWNMEFLFVDYKVALDPTLESSGGGTAGSPTNIAASPAVLRPQAAPAPVTVTFRQGVDGYAGVFGVEYDGVPRSSNSSYLWADWPDPGSPEPVQQGAVAILRFDDLFVHRAGRVPPGSTIITAKLRVTTGPREARGHGATVHRLRRPIDFHDVVNALLKDAQTNRFEVIAPPTSRVGSPTLQPVVEAGPIELDVTADVQSWAAGMGNHGWAFLPWPNGTDGWGFLKPDCPEVADRPSLTVTYIPPVIGHSAGGAGGSSTIAPQSPSRAVVTNPTMPPPAKATEPGKPIPPGPFRVATNGLAGRQFIDPITSWPDPHGFNKPDTAVRWATRAAFARLTTRAALVHPQLPVSRYVCEVELNVNERGGMKFCLGDFWNAAHICLDWKPEREMIRCEMAWWGHGTWWFLGGRDFAPARPISLKLVVGDGREILFNGDNQVLSRGDVWPTDCGLAILSENPDSAVIHRCSLRPLTAQNVAACGWTTPPIELPFKAGEAAARLAKISEGYPARPKAGERFVVKTTGTPMAWIPPGEFEMGSRDPKNEREPRHRVRLTRGYWMAQVEVTQGEFSKLTGANPSRVTGSPYLPVDWVAWDEAAAYCRKLTNLERKAKRMPPGYEYRLPTEAEWEYACRAGSDKDFSVPENLVWSRDPSGCRPHEVAESQPNNWKLYDMHGNAMEWCFDAWYDYPKGEKGVTIDPVKIGQPDKDKFVVRGGAW